MILQELVTHFNIILILRRVKISLQNRMDWMYSSVFIYVFSNTFRHTTRSIIRESS
jgi:hypothetical protein